MDDELSTYAVESWYLYGFSMQEWPKKWNCECVQETPNLEANISASTGTDWSPPWWRSAQRTYIIVTFSLTMLTGDLRTRGSENRVLSIQRVERFASEVLKGGKIYSNDK